MIVIFCSEARVENHFRSFSTKEVMSVTVTMSHILSQFYMFQDSIRGKRWMKSTKWSFPLF